MKRVIQAIWLLSCLASLPVTAHDGHHHPPAKNGNAAQLHFQKVAKALEKRLQTSPTDTVCLAKLGQLYLDAGRRNGNHKDFATAATYFRTTIELMPNHKGAAIGLSYSLLGRHRFAEALDTARMIGETSPQDVEIWALLADIHFALGNTLEAEMFAMRLAEAKPSLAAYARLAQIAEVRGSLDEAEALYKQALTPAGEYPATAAEIAWIDTMLAELYLQTNRVDLAAQTLIKTLDAMPEMHYAHWRLAQVLAHGGRMAKAEQHARAALSLAPEHAAYELTLGKILTQTEHSKSAKIWLDRGQNRILKEIAHGDLGHLRELATFWADHNQNLEAALALAQRDRTEIRQDWESAELVAWLSHLIGHENDALTHLSAALRPGVANPRLLLRAGIIYHHAGRLLLASHYLEMGLARADFVSPGLKSEATALFQEMRAHPERLRPPARSEVKVEPGEQMPQSSAQHPEVKTGAAPPKNSN